MVAIGRGGPLMLGSVPMNFQIRRMVVLAVGFVVAGCGGGTFFPYSTLPPEAPGSFTAELTSNNDAWLRWEAPGQTEGRAPVTGYEVYRELPDGRLEPLETTQSLSYRHSGLTPGVRYVFFVRALSEIGPSAPSASAFVDAVSIAVPHLTVRADEGTPKVVVSWIHRGASGDLTISTEIELQFCNVLPGHSTDRCDDVNGWRPVDGSPSDSKTNQFEEEVECDHRARTVRNARMYRVRAVEAQAGNGKPVPLSPYSAPTRPVCPGAYSPPRRVDAVFPEGGLDDQAHICWEVPEDNGSDVLGYELQVTPDEGLPATEDRWLIVDAHVRSSGAESRVCRRYAGLAEDDERWFRVRAYNLAGHGHWSAPYHYVHEPSNAFGSGQPSELSIADAQTSESSAAVLEFAVTLSPAASVPVTVEYVTVDGTARNGEDFDAEPGKLEFGAGEVLSTIAIHVKDDMVGDSEETFTVRLRNAIGARIADGEAVGTILNDDPIPKAWLARFGRTVADQVVDVVGARLERAPGSHVTIGGTPLEFSGTGGIPEALGRGALESTQDAWTERPAGSPGVAGRTLLRGSSFHLDSKGGGPVFAAWGAVAMDRFESDENELRMDGEVTTGVLGADVEGDRWLAGAAVSHSAADGSFAPGSGMAPVRGKNEVESRVTGVFPYARVGLSKRVSMWGLAGAGQGELTITENGRTPIETDLDMTVGAIGAHGTVLTPSEAAGFALAVRSDAFWVRMGSDAVRSASAGNLAATRADASRLRLTAAGSRAFPLGAHDTLTPTLEVGVRHDGGDAETGTGLEVGAGLRYAGDGITIEGAVRSLVAHEADGYEEWGASGSVRVTPGGSGRGFSLTLAPAIGVAPSRAERLWSLDFARTLAGDADAEAGRRLDGEVGYGVGLPSTSAVLTPYTGVALADGGPRAWRLGARLRMDPDLTLSLDGTRRDGIGGTPDHALTLRGALRW